jgi:hypothetical protein
MPFSDLYKQSQANLTSTLGNLTQLAATIAQIKQQRRNNMMNLLGTGLDIGAQFGGAALRNKYSQQAATTADQRARQMAEEEFARNQQAAREQRGFETRLSTAQAMAGTRNAAAQLRGNKEVEQMRIAGGAYDRGKQEPDTSKLIPFDIASQAWDTWWNRLATAEPKRQLQAKDFDEFRAVAVQAGAKYGFSREQMEDAVNTLANSYGFPTTLNQPPEATRPPAPSKPAVSGIPEHYKAFKTGVTETGKAIAGEAGKAWNEFSKIWKGRITEEQVLDSLRKAQQFVSSDELRQLETEILSPGNLPEGRLKKIMDRIKAVVGPYMK